MKKTTTTITCPHCEGTGHIEVKIKRKSPVPKKTDSERFWEKVDKITTPDGCWLWMGRKHTKRGAGRFDLQGSAMLAHRFAWEEKYGKVSKGMIIYNTVCHNNLCCNTDHYSIGTPADLMYSNEEMCKLLPHVNDIIALYATCQWSTKRIGKRYGVSGAAIGYVVRRQSYPHLPIDPLHVVEVAEETFPDYT